MSNAGFRNLATWKISRQRELLNGKDYDCNGKYYEYKCVVRAMAERLWMFHLIFKACKNKLSGLIKTMECHNCSSV